MIHNQGVNLRFPCKLNDPHAVRIELNKDKKKYSKAKQRGASIAYKWQWYTNYRHYPNGHANVDNHVKKQYRCYPITIYAREWRSLSLGQVNHPQY